ncbi:GNAT family N-acetyltransferase [Pseudomonas sp. HK3]
MRLMFLTLTYARVDAVTVNAVLTSVSAYEKYGFECSGDAGESSGLTYQPMKVGLGKLMQPAEVDECVCFVVGKSVKD